LARPGGNLTGLLQYEAGIAGKWLAMLKEIAPRIARAAVRQAVPSRERDDEIAMEYGRGIRRQEQAADSTPISEGFRSVHRTRRPLCDRLSVQQTTSGAGT
jgi:hypothetical protein